MEETPMALKHYEESRGKVSRIQSRLNQTIEDIRNNRSYSESGRRAEMAKATLAARIRRPTRSRPRS